MRAWRSEVRGKISFHLAAYRTLSTNATFLCRACFARCRGKVKVDDGKGGVRVDIDTPKGVTRKGISKGYLFGRDAKENEGGGGSAFAADKPVSPSLKNASNGSASGDVCNAVHGSKTPMASNPGRPDECVFILAPLLASIVDGDLTSTKPNPYRRVILSSLRRGSTTEMETGLRKAAACVLSAIMGNMDGGSKAGGYSSGYR
jgi:hypothetical protein